MSGEHEQIGLALNDPYYARRRAGRIVAAVKNALRRRGSATEVAKELDAIFAPEGRPVTEATLRACLNDSERNYLRFEWSVIVLDDPEVQAAMGEPLISPEEENRHMRNYLRVQAPGLLRDFDRSLGRSTP